MLSVEPHMGSGFGADKEQTGFGWIVMIILSLPASHGPVGSLVVKVSVTEPAAISAGEGVYCAFKVLALGLKVPAPPLHVPLLAPPPIEPAKVTVAPLAQIVWSAPAFAVAA